MYQFVIFLFLFYFIFYFLKSESDVWHTQPRSINVKKFVEMVGTSYLMFANLAVTT